MYQDPSESGYFSNIERIILRGTLALSGAIASQIKEMEPHKQRVDIILPGSRKAQVSIYDLRSEGFGEELRIDAVQQQQGQVGYETRQWLNPELTGIHSRVLSGKTYRPDEDISGTSGLHTYILHDGPRQISQNQGEFGLNAYHLLLNDVQEAMLAKKREALVVQR